MEFFETLAQTGIDKVLWGLAALFVCLVTARIINQAVEHSMTHMINVPASMHAMIKSTVRISLYIISLLVAGSVMGIPMTSFLALFSVVGLAVSLAIQGVLGNLTGGIIILVSKMFKVDDFIESDTISGTVREIGFLYTELASPDGKLIHVPNSLLQSSRVINYTALGTRRLDIPVSVSYDNTPAQVRSAAMEVVRQQSGVMAAPAPEVLLDSYGDSGINYIVRMWTKCSDYWPTRFAINEEIYGVFKKHGVEITYPHLNVHLDQK